MTNTARANESVTKRPGGTHPALWSRLRGPLLRWAIFTAALVFIVTGGMGLAQAATPEQRVMTIIVIPHPDDEFQTWSLVENTPNDYKVFVVMTHGEETQFCHPDGLQRSLQDGLVPAPTPLPEGQWTSSCAQARMSSLRDFLRQMAESDPTIPGDFGVEQVSEVLPAAGTAVCTDNDGVVSCDDDLRRVSTWVDTAGRGAIVSFNLGDGDLTSAEATWALQRVVDSRAELSIDTDLPIRAMIGAFANGDYGCYPYPHPDHVAVHDALWRTEYGPWPRLAASCLLDPATELTARVTDRSAQAAFDTRSDSLLGAHVSTYGWLHETHYPLAYWRQSTLFMQVQSFWIRGNN
jgi:hypothetical protein